MKNNFWILIFGFIIILSNCQSQKSSNFRTKETILHIDDLQNGDLIFVGAQTEQLSGAINRVTQISKEANFDHIGLIEKTKDSIFVLHAAPIGGSQREEVHHFYKSQTEKNNRIVIYRLKNNYQHSIPNAISTAKTLLGKPYNWTYILNENEYYCSDFIERAFRKDEIFDLIEMNFKNKETDKIDDFWIDFYRKKNLEVPQDQPGTNPNQLANSEKLNRIGIILLDL